METRHLVLAVVVLVTAVLAVRGFVAARSGEFGILARQAAVGAVVFAFGVGLYRNWDAVGA